MAIRAYLDGKLDDMKKIVSAINQQIATLTAYHKSLIHECVTGQRRTTEADLREIRTRSASEDGR